MKNRIVDVRNGMLFPWHFLFMAGVVFIASLALLSERTLLGLILISASVFVLSGYSGIEIDPVKKQYREYRSFFLVNGGKYLQFNEIEKIYINMSKVTQKVHTAHTNHSSLFSNVEFNAWLKLDTGEKIHLLSKRDKEKLLATLGVIARELNTRVEDQTISIPVA